MAQKMEPVSDVPWEWFGAGKKGPSWERLFDEIEQERDLTQEVE